METFVKRLRQDFPTLLFVSGDVASWSANTGQVTYTDSTAPSALWTLLHELGHALLGHTSYESDSNLLLKEAAAWEEALALAKKYKQTIDTDHIQNCLDTYRDWVFKRSTCPDCGQHGVQPSQSLYSCLNCQNTWKVSSARFCRPYRLKSALTQ